MAVKITFEPQNPEQADASGSIKIKINGPEDKVTLEMNARRALNGDIMITEHDLIDIIVSPSKSKIITFPKKLSEREAYPVQDRLLIMMRERGIVDPSTIQGGNIFMSLEATLHESVSESVDAVQSAIFVTSTFLEEEKPDIMARKHLQHDLMMHWANPEEEESTELGQVPHSDRKGSMDSRVRPYGYQYMYSVLRESEDK